jgi:hypothetical protein
MTGRLGATASMEDLCNLQEDASVIRQKERLKGTVENMVESCADQGTVDHVGRPLLHGFCLDWCNRYFVPLLPAHDTEIY